MATSLEPKCYPSADRDSNSASARTSRVVRRNEATTSSPHRNQQRKRPSHLPRHRSRIPSNPFFFRRRAREEGILAGDWRRGRGSATSDDTVNNSDNRGRRDLLARRDVLHIIGVSEGGVQDEPLGHGKRRLSRQPKSSQVQTIFAEQRGSGRGIECDVGKPFGGPAQKKTNLIRNKSLPQSGSPESEYPAGLAYNPAELLDDGIFGVDLAAEKGTVRRKTMRTVSQDDYLLARGANPRTGVVTPSDHSGCSSAGSQERCRMTGASPPAKWRLKGDQWVSLGLDEPSPLPTSPYGSHGRRGARMLRIPPKLAHGRGTGNRMNDHIFRQKRMDRLKPAADTMTLPQQIERQDNHNIRTIEKGQPSRIQATAFPSQLFSRDVDGSGKHTLVRRKPLGTPVTKPSVDKPSNSNGHREASTETVITRTNRAGQFRSSSMPTPRKIRAFGSEDVNKALPALPAPEANENRNFKEGSRSQAMPFLGLRDGDGREDVLGHASLNGHGSEKSLPCPPMKDMPFHSLCSEIVGSKGLTAMTMPLNINKSENQQHKASRTCHTEGRSTALDSKPRMAPTQYQLTGMTGVSQRTEQHTPTIDHNVSYTKPSRPTPKVHSQIMNVDMTKRSKGTAAGSEVQPSQSTTTPIATAQTLPEDRLVSWSWREMPSPVRPGRQITNVASRPAMPERAEGTHTVPQVSPQKGLPDQYQSRMTGTSDGNVSATSTPVERSPERDLVPPPLRLNNGKTKRYGWVGEVAAEDVGGAEPPTTSYPHCQAPCSGVRKPKMQWSAQTQEIPLAGNTDPQVESNITHGFSQDMAEDHSGCCSKCCVVGSHGSCLGHGYPPRKGTAGGFAGYLDATKEAFRNSMRLSRRMRTRTSVGGSHETETEEVAELETPMPWKISGAVSFSTASEMDAQNFCAEVRPQTDSRGKRVGSSGSNASLKTMEIPYDASISAVIEALMVPFGALRMWLKKHPQLLALLQVAVLKLMEMSKHVLATTGLAYRVAYIYSKNGTISPGKHTTLSGFVKDCVKGVVYSLVLGAVFMMVGRVLAVLAGAGSWLIWSLSWVIWMVKAAGLGMLW